MTLQQNMFKSRNECHGAYKCTVRLLDDSDILECEFQPYHKGVYIIDQLCKQLNIKESDYFGLRYVDTSMQRHWLDLAKSILKQCKDLEPILFSLRVKFYPADPFRLTGSGRIMLYQQLKRDLRHGRLYCSLGEAAALGSLIVQEELGDYNEDIHKGDYVSSIELTLRRTDNLEKKITELHKKRAAGHDSSAAAEEFMGIARCLETYGIEPHPVKDHRGSHLYIGVNHSGISSYVAGKRSQHFRWNEVHKINFEGKMFIIHLSFTDVSREPKKHTIGFKCPSSAACRYLWRCAIEQMLFFTLPKSQDAAVISGGGFFSWGTKFRYSGRTEREILTDSINALREQKLTSSTATKPKSSSVPATPSSPQSQLSQIRYCSLPRSTLSEPLGYSWTLSSASFRGQNQESCEAKGSFPISNLEPVCEEARLRLSNIDILNLTPTQNLGYKYGDRSNSSSNESGLAVTICSQKLDHNAATKEQHQRFNAFSNTNCISNSKTVDNFQNAHPVAIVKTAKTLREFRLLHAFIPSFIFVAVAMAGAAVYVMESEHELFEKVRNTPEMLSLRFQYYEPLKLYFFNRFGHQN
ncbi:FERM domain-containing protein 5 isoform X2 [Drosophila tropicalis]